MKQCKDNTNSLDTFPYLSVRSFYKNPPKENKELRKEKEALMAELCEVPQLKAAIAGLEADNDELRAMNASLAQQLRGHHAVGKKHKKKVPKNSTVKDDWGDLENSDPAADAMLFLEEEGDYVWYSDFLGTPISFTPEL